MVLVLEPLLSPWQLKVSHGFGMLPLYVVVLIDDAAQHVCLLLPLETFAITEALLIHAYGVVAEMRWERLQWRNTLLHGFIFIIAKFTTWDRCHAA